MPGTKYKNTSYIPVRLVLKIIICGTIQQYEEEEKVIKVYIQDMNNMILYGRSFKKYDLRLTCLIRTSLIHN